MEELNVVEMNQNAVEITPPQTPVINMSEHAQKTMESHGVIVGEIGTKISRVPIEKYKASTRASYESTSENFNRKEK